MNIEKEIERLKGKMTQINDVSHWVIIYRCRVDAVRIANKFRSQGYTCKVEPKNYALMSHYVLTISK